MGFWFPGAGGLRREHMKGREEENERGHGVRYCKNWPQRLVVSWSERPRWNIASYISGLLKGK